MASALEGCGGQNDPLPVSTPSHSYPMNASLHSRCFHRGGRERGRRGRRERRRDGGLRGREVVFLFSLAPREGKTIGANGRLSLIPGLPPHSVVSLQPSFLNSGYVERRVQAGCWLSVNIGRNKKWRVLLVGVCLCCLCIFVYVFLCAHACLCAGQPVKGERPPVSF